MLLARFTSRVCKILEVDVRAPGNEKLWLVDLLARRKHELCGCFKVDTLSLISLSTLLSAAVLSHLEAKRNRQSK
jgi:hypothetical protein